MDEESPAEEAFESPAEEASESQAPVQPFLGGGVILFNSQHQASKSRRMKKHKHEHQ